ncbi:MAG: HAMP domain-containing protein [Dehalococcoidia bacterium]
MANLHGPVGAFFNRLSISRKLALLVAVLVVPVALLAYFAVDGRQAEIDLATNERDGLQYLEVLNSLLISTQEHRSLAVFAVQGNANAKQRLETVRANIDSQVASLKKADDRTGVRFETGELTAKAAQLWADVTATVAAGGTPSDIERKNDRLTDSLLEYLFVVGNTSELYLDPETASLQTVLATMDSLPRLGVAVDDVQASFEETSGQIGLVGRASVAAGLTRVDDLQREVTRALDLARQSNTSYDRALEQPLLATQVAVKDYIIAVQDELAGRQSGLRTKEDAVQASSRDLVTAAERVLRTDLTERVSTNRREQSLVVAIAVVSSVVAILFAWLISRSITRPVNQLVAAADQVSLGELETQIRVKGSPEVVRMAEALTRMQTSLASAIERLRTRRAAA